ncbi:MAG TPA: KamA family radical SAM protein, partial [Polyangia bacterium]|nr:KamA family radical SAM protein [Polyangia bacterium]
MDVAPPAALKPPVDPGSLAHRDLQGGEFWRAIPAYAQISEAEFLDHKWQAKHSVTNVPKLLAAVSGLVS